MTKTKTNTTKNPKSDQPKTLNEAIKVYVKTIENNLKMKTRYELSQFAKHLGPDRSLTSLSPPEIGDYGDLLSSRIAVSDTHDRMDSVKKFLLFLHDEELIDENMNLATHIRSRRSYRSRNMKKVSNLSLPNQPTITKSRHNALTKKLKLLLKERNRLAETIQIAAQDKDVRENAPLEAAREAQGINTAKINEVESMLRGAVIVADEKGKIQKGIISLGSNVTVQNQNNQSKSKYRIVDPSESDPLANRISSESPLAKSLMGKSEKEIIQVKAPNETTIEFKILKVI
tara:strand:- start:319 stop:1179 length:861 start_codon:yes stop_codon:yes gene_type:complete